MRWMLLVGVAAIIASCGSTQPFLVVVKEGQLENITWDDLTNDPYQAFYEVLEVEGIEDGGNDSSAREARLLCKLIADNSDEPNYPKRILILDRSGDPDFRVLFSVGDTLLIQFSST